MTGNNDEEVSERDEKDEAVISTFASSIRVNKQLLPVKERPETVKEEMVAVDKEGTMKRVEAKERSEDVSDVSRVTDVTRSVEEGEIEMNDLNEDEMSAVNENLR